jgi:hypothetical protein
MTRDMGAPDKPTGLSQAEPVSRLGPSGFDPSRWPYTRAALARLKAAFQDWRATVMLRKHGAQLRTDRIIRRKSDGTWWIPGAPQSLGYAMLGLFTKRRLDFHFYRVRDWRGVLIASRRVFWLAQSGKFDLLINCPHYQLPPWPMDIECRKIDAAIATEARRAETENTGSVHDGPVRRTSPKGPSA